MKMDNENVNTKSKVDEAIARAKAKIRAQAAFVDEDTQVTESVEKQTTKLSDQEKQARKDRLAVERAEKNAERERVREQKKAERAAAQERKKTERALKALQRQQERASAGPAHMTKVEKAASKLPSLGSSLSEDFASLTEKFTVGELNVLIAHLQVSNRAKQTLASNSVNFEVGQQVRITSSELDVSLIGKVGTVTEMRKIRVLLEVDGVNKPVYLFAADCEALNEQVCNAEVADEPSESVTEDNTEEVTDEDVQGTDVDDEGFLSISEESDTESTGTDG
jgi:flagellar biosynthesis GTPase FlhF